MKRWLLVVLPITLAIGFWFFLRWDPMAPRFKALRSFQPPAYAHLSYNFLDSRPFAGGKMWVQLHNGSNWGSAYLFDLERRRILGEIENAGPVFLNADQTEVLCVRRGPGAPSLFDKFRRVVESSLPQRYLPWKRKGRVGDDIETFWMLDLASNRAVPIGNITQFKGAGSTFRASPDLHYAFNRSVAESDRMLICDLQKKTGRILNLDGWPLGWWDNRTVLFQNQTNDFMLMDAESGRVSPLLRATNVTAFLDGQGIGRPKQRTSAFASWNGRDYDFYVTDTHQKWLAAGSFLLKMEKPSARLTVVSPEFRFGWSDHFDESQRYYAFSGREAGTNSDAVFVRDLKRMEERVVVRTDGARWHSIPNFYGSDIIYFRSNQLWRVGVDGSNNIRLFPP